MDPPILPSASSVDLTDDGPSVPDESPENGLRNTSYTSHLHHWHLHAYVHVEYTAADTLL